MLTSSGIPVIWDISVDKSFGNRSSHLIAEFDVDKNYPITPFDIGAQSDKKLYWKCKQGHSWEAIVGHRVRGDGCPYCNSRSDIPIYKNSLEGWCLSEENIAFRFLLDEYNSAGNEVKASEVYRSSNKRFSWVCHKCRKRFEMAPNLRTDGFINTCPFCEKDNYRSKSEQIVYNIIKEAYPFLKIEKQKSFEGLGKKSFDFFIPELRVLIEYDGDIWHKQENNAFNDRIKNAFAVEHDYKLIRIVEHIGETMLLLSNNISNKEAKPWRTVLFNYRARKTQEWYKLYILMKSIIDNEFKLRSTSLSIDDIDKCRNDANYEVVKAKSSNSFKSKFPFLASFWSDENKIGPDKISNGTSDKYKFVCPIGHTEEKHITNIRRHPDYYSCNTCKRLGIYHIYKIYKEEK